MNILMIGNGFDLAHGLPTKYTDFLEFVEMITQVLDLKDGDILEELDWKGINLQIKKLIIDNTKIGSGKENLFSRKKEWEDLIKDNFWFQYFQGCDMYEKYNWIDFESEISQVIKCIDKRMVQYDLDLYSLEYSMKNEYLNETNIEYKEILKIVETLVEDKNEVKYKDIIDLLKNDMNRLIKALEWYLCSYVKEIDIEKRSLDIEEINPDKILSFNYTGTYNLIYHLNQSCEYDYIHGKADISNTIDTNNMVLGIDEYLSDDKKDKEIEFIAFKKFYQRIHKETGCQYKEWVDEIRKNYLEYMREQKEADTRVITYPADSRENIANSVEAALIKNEKCKFHNLVIFGHSLDVTDGDILRDLILNDNVYTTIYYLNKDVMGQQIANLVKVIGQDELIRRTGGSTKTIEFKQQQIMVEV